MLLQHTVSAVALHALNWYLRKPSHAEHARNDVDPIDEAYVLPETQSAHVVSPAVGAYLPAAQVAHTVRPRVAANLPAEHIVHEPLEPKYPTLHVHCAIDVEPAGELEFTGQLGHVMSAAVAQFALLYWPAPHPEVHAGHVLPVL